MSGLTPGCSRWPYGKLRRLESRARDYCCLREDLAGAEDDLRIAVATDVWVEENADLIAAVRALPRRQGEVIILHYLTECTIGETARILGVHEGTVKKHLNRGLENLRQHQGVSVTQELTRRIPA